MPMRHPRTIVVLDAPSNLGLRPPHPGAVPGVWKLADALRAEGIIPKLAAMDGGRVPVPAYSADPDPETGFRNGPGLRAFTPTLADRVQEIVRARRFPLVLGGDCSILLGSLLALRSLGHYGLVFLDGHDDFCYPRDRAHFAGSLAAASLDLALATGHGPESLTNLRGMGPYMREEDVVMFGHSPDPRDAEVYAMEDLLAARMTRFEVGHVREAGAAKAAREALASLSKDLEGFWIHLDADVLDETVMPAVDSPNPSGLTATELADALKVFLGHEKAAGMEVTILDPERDPDGRCAATLVGIVVGAVSSGLSQS